MRGSSSAAAAAGGMLGFFIFQNAMVTTTAFSIISSLTPDVPIVQLNAYGPSSQSRGGEHGDRSNYDHPGMQNGEYPHLRMSAPMIPHENDNSNNAVEPYYGSNKSNVQGGDGSRRMSAPMVPDNNDVFRHNAVEPYYGGGTVQGSGSRKTWSNANDINIASNGGPVNAELEWWDGPDNTPMRMNVYSQDGYSHPIRAVTPGMAGGGQPYYGHRGHAVSVRNTGPLEFPISADVAARHTSPSSSIMADGAAGGPAAGQHHTRKTGSGSSRSQTIQGCGTIATFPFDESVQSVQVTMWSEGRPICAKIELLQGPNNVKTLADIYNEGTKGPFSAIMDTPGPSGVLQIENTGPMEFPINARVEPYGYSNNGGGGSDNYYGYGGSMYSAPNNTPLP